jgi:RNase P/RNase MRP subunit p29
MAEQEKNTKVDILGKVVGQRELPKLDVSKYIGKKAKIVSTEEHEGVHGYYVKVTTESLGEFNGSEVTASRIAGLIEFDDGNIGWGDDSKMSRMLKEFGVKHYTELVGKEVTIITTQPNNEGQKYLTF